MIIIKNKILNNTYIKLNITTKLIYIYIFQCLVKLLYYIYTFYILFPIY